MSTTGAELDALDTASRDTLRVSLDLRDEQDVLRGVVGRLARAAGLRPARLACDEAGEVLLRGLRGLRDGVELLGHDAARQHDLFDRAGNGR